MWTSLVECSEASAAFWQRHVQHRRSVGLTGWRGGSRQAQETQSTSHEAGQRRHGRWWQRGVPALWVGFLLIILTTVRFWCWTASVMRVAPFPWESFDQTNSGECFSLIGISFFSSRRYLDTGWSLTWKNWQSQGIAKWSGKMRKSRETIISFAGPHNEMEF